MSYATAITATPILNIPDFPLAYGLIDGSLFLDQKGFFRPLETIAFPDTVFTVVKECGKYILEVTTNEYPSKNKLFIDKRFVKVTEEKPSERFIVLPPYKEIKEKLLAHLGRPYVWGGNTLQPIYEIHEYYPSKSPLSPYENIIKICDGIDCSGLIYHATNGFVPRNTSDMYYFGNSLEIENKKLEEIILKPLDLILSVGHVIIVLDDNYTIQSKEKFGVYIIPTKDVLSSFLKRKKPKNRWDPSMANDIFIINRWFNQ